MRHITPTLSLVACLAAAPAAAGPELKKSDVKDIISDSEAEIRRCGAQLKGETVKARFTIQPEGNVTGVKVLGKHAKSDVGRCMAKHIAAMRFGHSIKATPVTYPFRLGRDLEAVAPTAASSKLTKKDLDGLLEILEGDLKKCGEGQAQTRFTIKPNGQVRDVKVDDVDEKTGECVQKKVSRLRFPPPTKATVVDRTFTLDDA